MKKLVKVLLSVLASLAIIGCDSIGLSPDSAPESVEISSDRITENNAVGDIIGTISATDDYDTSFVYELGGDDESSFTLDGSDLIANEVFDFETKETYEIIIAVADSKMNITEVDFTIYIDNEREATDVNYAPTDLSLSSTSMLEDTVSGTTVASITVVDDYDANSGLMVYTLSGADSASFTISETDIVYAGGAIDMTTKTDYSITLTATDDWDATYSEDFTITATNVTVPTDYMVYFDFEDDDALLGTGITTSQDESAFNISGETDYYVPGVDGEVSSDTTDAVAVATMGVSGGADGAYAQFSSNRVDYIKVNDTPSADLAFGPSESFSASVWIYINSPDFTTEANYVAPTDAVIFDHYDSSTSTGFKVELDQYSDSAYEIEFIGYNGLYVAEDQEVIDGDEAVGDKREYMAQTGSTAFNYDGWTHFVFVYQGESTDGAKDGTLSIYVNGALADQETGVRILENADEDGKDSFCIGGNTTTHSDSNMNKTFHGEGMDELYLYNKALSSYEIDALYGLEY